MNYLYEDTCVNTCPDGSYAVTSISTNLCLKCINNCRICQSATYCLTCISGTYLDTNTHSCIDYCPVGYYIDVSIGCIQCPVNCLTCVYNNRVICITCAFGYMMQDGGYCVSSCNDGYVLISGLCHKC